MWWKLGDRIVGVIPAVVLVGKEAIVVLGGR